MEPRNYEDGAAGTPPPAPSTPSTGYPTQGNPQSAIPATKPGAHWFYKVGESLRKIIVEGGLTPDDDDLTQLVTSIQIMIGSVPTVPVGSVLIMDGDVIPSGYLKRNGAALSRTVYADLWTYAQSVSNFVAQATKDGDYETYAGYYGTGDDSTTFTLPDSRGEFIRSWDDGRGIDSSRAIAEHQLDAFGSHNHVSGTPENSTSQAYYGLETGLSSKTGFSGGNTKNGSPFTSTEGASETRPRNVAMMFCVKY